MASLKKFLSEHKKWCLLLGVFLAVRVLMFVSFWQASADKGGWQNFYLFAQPAPFVFRVLFHDFCDWHPPLYYTLTSQLLYVFGSQWAIYAAQMILSFVSLVLAYKIVRVFFSEKIAFWSVLLLAAEPFWAWHNWLLVSENLFTPLLLAGFLFVFRFVKFGKAGHLYLGALFLGLATLTRPNTLLLPAALTIFFISLFFLRGRLRLEFLSEARLRKFLIHLALFNAIFVAVLAPWVISNKLIYGRFTLANIASTNIYFYNLPPLISMQKNIPYSEALDSVKKQADDALGQNVGDQGNCYLFSRQEFSRQLDFFETESRKYILANLPAYLKMHFIRAMPFFLQPGYHDMYFAYTGEFKKPDITGLLLRGDFDGIRDFLFRIDSPLIIYFFGIIIWGIASLSLAAACVYSFFKDKRRSVFFLIAAFVTLYNALLISPFVIARYRLPLYIFFVVSMVYLFGRIFFKKRADENAD